MLVPQSFNSLDQVACMGCNTRYTLQVPTSHLTSTTVICLAKRATTRNWARCRRQRWTKGRRWDNFHSSEVNPSLGTENYCLLLQHSNWYIYFFLSGPGSKEEARGKCQESECSSQKKQVGYSRGRSDVN